MLTPPPPPARKPPLCHLGALEGEMKSYFFLIKLSYFVMLHMACRHLISPKCHAPFCICRLPPSTSVSSFFCHMFVSYVCKQIGMCLCFCGKLVGHVSVFHRLPPPPQAPLYVVMYICVISNHNRSLQLHQLFKGHVYIVST